MPKESSCHIVVDQSSYLGVIIPTDVLLARIASERDFKIKQIIKCRKANTSGQQLNEYPYLENLRESIVSFEK
jgi:hypothetical protein